ncbi:MAG: quinolinate synthase NadA [Maricaulaceae bacterium]
MDQSSWTRLPLREPNDDAPAAFAVDFSDDSLTFTDAVRDATAPLYERVKDVVTPMEWPSFAPLIHAINTLKAEKNAVILAHNYMTPEIFNCVGDYSGDSLQLARLAAETNAEVIVQAGVHFMAETSKILSPEKTVLIPDMRAGCSLAASITGADVRLIKERYPGLPIVTYVNTSAEVKAESDICCTSSNAVQVVEAIAKQFGTDQVIMIPDQYLAKNVAAQTDIRILTWAGACEVHERFTAQDIADIREAHPGVVVLAHPECPPDVLQASDYAGSTSAMGDFVRESGAQDVVLITECSMSDNVAVENPGVNFIRPCNLSPHMKRITLRNLYDALRFGRHAVEVNAEVSARARAAIQAMLDLPKPDRPARFDPQARPRHAVAVI